MSTICAYDYLTLGLSTLTASGMLREEHLGKWCLIAWEEVGELIGSIEARITNISQCERELVLKYTVEGNDIQVSYRLVSVQSNLGIGVRWYFVCPHTGKRCIKLHKPCGSKYFHHRSAFKMLYETQRRSRAARQLDNTFGKLFQLDDLYHELRQPYRKTHYRRKPTPLMTKIINLEDHLSTRNKYD